MSSIVIEGYSDDQWSPIVKGIDLHLERGEVLGLIGGVRGWQINSWAGLHGIHKARVPGFRQAPSSSMANAYGPYRKNKLRQTLGHPESLMLPRVRQPHSTRPTG